MNDEFFKHFKDASMPTGPDDPDLVKKTLDKLGEEFLKEDHTPNMSRVMTVLSKLPELTEGMDVAKADAIIKMLAVALLTQASLTDKHERLLIKLLKGMKGDK